MSTDSINSDIVQGAISKVEMTQSGTFFPVGTVKLVVMHVCTFTLYEFYWFYKNFKCMKIQGYDIWPVPRALFYPVMSYSLFNAVQKQSKKLKFRPLTLALTVFLLSTSTRLPDPWPLIGFLSFLPLLPVCQAINSINREVAPDLDSNNRIRGWNYLAVCLGGISIILILIGLFVPIE